MALTEARDLRGGNPTWDDDTWDLPRTDDLPTGVNDVAIIGSGIMGSILAERLSADGLAHRPTLLARASMMALGELATSMSACMAKGVIHAY